MTKTARKKPERPPQQPEKSRLPTPRRLTWSPSIKALREMISRADDMLAHHAGRTSIADANVWNRLNEAVNAARTLIPAVTPLALEETDTLPGLIIGTDGRPLSRRDQEAADAAAGNARPPVAL